MTRNAELAGATAVFLGGGRITSAILAGLKVAGSRDRVVVHDHNQSKLKLLRRLYAVTVEPQLEQAIAQAGLLVIAVRPDAVPFLLRDMKAILTLQSKRQTVPPRLAVSLAAGIQLVGLRQMLGPHALWARAMPSPVCRTGNGLTALVFERGFPPRRRSQVRDFLRKIGSLLELPERKFDAFTVTYSSSHGYYALEALADAGRQFGLDRKTALTAASHALADGINSWRRQNIPLDRLLEAASTPGGIAEATMAAMDRNGYREAVQRGLRAGLARARAIARP